jgi:twitching motility protein PilT
MDTAPTAWEDYIASIVNEHNPSDIVIRSSGDQELVVNGSILQGSVPDHLVPAITELFQYICGGEIPSQSVEDVRCFAKRRHRASLTRNSRGHELVLRVLAEEIPDPETIGLARDLVGNFVRLRNGIVLVTGATGSGKTTTIASLVQEWAKVNSGRIITLENPIEYVFRNTETSTFTQRQIGDHCESFSMGLTEALRMAPSVIVVQELRNAAELETAIAAALSGHLVVSTLHSTRAFMAVQRMISILSDTGTGAAFRDAVATTLQGIISQCLEYNPQTNTRIAVREILYNNDAIAARIRDGNAVSIRQVMETGTKRTGMVTMEQARQSLVAAGKLPR